MLKNPSSKPKDNLEGSIHRVGRITLFAGFIVSLLPPLLLWLVYGIVPPVKKLLNGIISISSVMLPVSIVEVMTFTPILGAGAIYMSYLTGNVSNMKIPSAAVAIEAVGVKPSTKEGDIIANLAIAASVLTGVIILCLGVLLIIPISPWLNSPVVKPAFDQILPAMFGAIGAYYFLKEWKLAVAPLLMAIMINVATGGISSSITIPLCVLVSILSAKFLHNRNLIGMSQKIEG